MTWMRRLGLEGAFRADGHLPIVAHRSQWGADTIESTDMINSAHGGSWVLRRGAFDTMLRKTATLAGAIAISGPAGAVQRTREKWTFEADGEPQHASFLIDASGRRTAVARRIGTNPVADDRLVAVSFVTETHIQSDVDQTTLLEASENGWWYTCRIGACQRLVSYFSDADLIPTTAATRSRVLPRSLDASGPVASLLREHQYANLEAHEVGAAHSGHLEPMVGGSWMATGDAAVTYDPLCGHGLIAAMDSARYAAVALIELARGNGPALEDYAIGMTAGYQRYRNELRAYYGAETRWKNSQFWSRRRADAPAG